MTHVRIRAPATIANLGPGFDCLALAVQLHNELSAAPSDSGLRLRLEGEGQGQLPTDSHNLIVEAAQLLANAHGKRLPDLELLCHNRIPLASGLGSSAAAIISGLLAADALLETELSHAQLLALATQLEGHPDNVTAALLGGLVIVGPGRDPPLYRRVEPAIDQLVAVLPELELPTRRMREALPETVPLGDAAFNIGLSALMVEALRAGDFSLLAEAMDDRLHQPYRSPHIPGFKAVVLAARKAGAAAVALAGAGPGLVALAERDLALIGDAMVAAFQQVGVAARRLVLPVDRHGAQVFLE